jgi:DNA-directed RNA polymerase subunit H (RpoH/RPB5)
MYDVRGVEQLKNVHLFSKLGDDGSALPWVGRKDSLINDFTREQGAVVAPYSKKNLEA